MNTKFTIIFYTTALLFISLQVFADFSDIIVNTTPYVSDTPKNMGTKQIETPPGPSSSTNSKNIKKKTPDFFSHNQKAPVEFQGDVAKGSFKNGMIQLLGNVVITQDETTLKSNQARIYRNQTAHTPSKDISDSTQRVLATGNVKILKKTKNNLPEMTASCDEVEFLVPKRILILKGKAKVWKDQEFVNADVIMINLDTGDIQLKSPKGTMNPAVDNRMLLNDKLKN